MSKTVRSLPTDRMPDWRLFLVSIVFFANAYWWSYVEGIIIPDTAFFVVAGIVILWLSFNF